MTYKTALLNAWRRLEEVGTKKYYEVRFLNDRYTVNTEEKTVFSLSCNVPVKDYIAILILHYIAKKLTGLPPANGDWLSFKEIEGGEVYYPTFKKRTIDVIKNKYGQNPDGLLDLVERFQAKTSQIADASIVLEAFEGAPILITLWRGDEEFGPEANVLFDRSITDIFCAEDIVVLSEIISHSM